MAERFPDPSLASADGLVAIGLDLSPETLLEAYAKGIFPWFSEGEPMLWWSPDPRMVLFPHEFHVSRRLRRRIHQGRFRISEDQAFADVMHHCAASRRQEDGTWIVAEMIEAYVRLFELGHARSVEVWDGDALVGGLYGICLGKVFFAESMFSRRTDASKIALAHLVERARREGWALIDCQFNTRHLASLGARLIPRRVFLQTLNHAAEVEK
ncbi:MAG: leucyl/phenylalanyl-tRNA--protein transferase [Mariprofundaceae bacterium]